MVGPRVSAAIKADFGRRFKRALTNKGMNQSEFSRHAEALAPKGISLARDKISKYAMGLVLPNDPTLKVLADALGTTPEELLPSRFEADAPVGEIPPLALEDKGDGIVWLKVNQAVPWAKALAIMNILKGE